VKNYSLRSIVSSYENLGEKVALIDEQGQTTYHQLRDGIGELALFFKQRQIAVGSRVIIWLPNCREHAIATVATIVSGQIAVPVNPVVPPSKLLTITQDCTPEVLITTETLLCQLQREHAIVESIRHIIVTSASAPDKRLKVFPQQGTFTRWDQLPRANQSHQPSPMPSDTLLKDKETCMLIYTSGSTGVPKGVMMSYKAVSAAIDAITEYLGNTESDRILCCLPLSFDYGLYQVLMALSFGGSIVIENGFAFPTRVIQKLSQFQITGFPIVPAISARICSMPKLQPEAFATLRYITNTGQALPQPHIRTLTRLCPQTALFSMYGLTECKRVSFLPPEKILQKPQSVGQSMKSCRTWLIDQNQQRITTPHTVGQLIIAGENLMSGYWENQEQTASALYRDPASGAQALRSGDLFYFDEDGDLYFVGRMDDVIKTGGERVSPKEVENVLYDIESVAEAAVVTTEDPVLGNALIACIAFTSKALLSPKDVQRHCRQHLEPYACPKKVVIYPTLPKTPNGKIDKKALQSIHATTKD